MLDQRKSIKALLLGVACLFLFTPGESNALCKGDMFNPITDICWQCMFPARIGGATFGPGGRSSAVPGGTGSPACACPTATSVRVGISAAFWEHARAQETVKDEFCFPVLGYTKIGGSGGASGNVSQIYNGELSSTPTKGKTASTTTNVHHLILPIWVLLNMFADMPCVEKQPFDIAYLSEVDPLWSDDSKSLVINPEAALFGNPITQASCMADSVASTAYAPLDPLFWCFGSWGSAYPLSGTSTTTNPVDYNAQLAARMTFKLGREGLLWDTGMPGNSAMCRPNGTLSPIMVKSHYKLQIAKPKKGSEAVPIGRSSLIWGADKNPPMGRNSAENFLFIMMRARTCCVAYTL